MLIANSPLTLTAGLLYQDGTGTVTFRDNGATLGVSPVSHQYASITTTLGTGTHVIEAEYSGDATYVGSTARTTITVGFAGGGPPTRRRATR